MSVNLEKMSPLFDDDVPLTFPDGSPIPVGLTLLLATQEHITPGEARRRLIESWWWWGGPGNRAQRRREMKRKK